MSRGTVYNSSAFLLLFIRVSLSHTKGGEFRASKLLASLESFSFPSISSVCRKGKRSFNLKEGKQGGRCLALCLITRMIAPIGYQFLLPREWEKAFNFPYRLARPLIVQQVGQHLSLQLICEIARHVCGFARVIRQVVEVEVRRR